MNTYRIDWSVTVAGDDYSGTVEVKDRTMNHHMARQYAAHDVPDDVVYAAGFNVHEIDVDWERVDR